MTKKETSENIQMNRLKVVLAEKNISQKELAERLQISPHTISRICSNVHQPSIKFLREISFALEIDVRELLVSTR